MYDAISTTELLSDLKHMLCEVLFNLGMLKNEMSFLANMKLLLLILPVFVFLMWMIDLMMSSVFLAKPCHQFPHVINTVTNICVNNNPITVCIARHSTGCLSQKSESECLVSGRVSNQGPTECRWEAFSLGLTVLVCIYCSVNCVRLMCVNSLNNNID